MRVRLGYACISKTLNGVTTSSNYTYTNFNKERDFMKLDCIIRSNLADLEKIIDYNIANHIHFFRLSSKLVPLATHPDVEFDYLKAYSTDYRRIGDKIDSSKMRIDFHPDQFCVLNSVKKEVVEASIESLKYHYNLLNVLRVQDKTLVLHIGSNVFGKEKSLSRFVNQFRELDENIQRCIVIENDDKVFDVVDCLELSSRIGVPVVLDYHHFVCNNHGENFKECVEKIFATWGDKTPKVHFSSPKNRTKKEFRSHHDYINADDFIGFIENMKFIGNDFDVMIEAKAKDEALFRLVRELKYKTNYTFVDETTFEVM